MPTFRQIAIDLWRVIHDEVRTKSITPPQVGNAGQAVIDYVDEVGRRVAALENAPAPVSSHSALEGKNAEADVQHLTAAEKDRIKTKTLIVSKNGLNGAIAPSLFSFPKKIKIISTKCEANCSNLSIKIGVNIYDKTSIVNVEIDAEVAIEVLDINILAGKNNGNARIIFKEI